MTSATPRTDPTTGQFPRRDMMAFGGPGVYLQGPGLSSQLGERVEELGKRPLVLVDAALIDMLRGPLDAGLGPLARKARFIPFGGECTTGAIAEVAEAGRESRCDFVIAVGGGKTIDTAKGARITLDVPLVVMPSIASNDSPTSRLVVVYDDTHVLTHTLLMRRSPDLVLVDTEWISRAPPRFLLAGIGDAISKRFEVEQAVAVAARNFFGGHGGQTALAIARHCYDTLRQDAPGALDAVRRQQTDAALERVVEVCVLGSGLAFESGGLSIAHSMLRGFSVVPSLARSLHGEQVAVGLMVQLHVGSHPGVDVEELLGFYRRIGLPSTMFDLGLDQPLEAVAAPIVDRILATSPYIGNFSPAVTRDSLLRAMHKAHGA